MNEELIRIRHHLHSNPELSKKEKETSAYIIKQLEITKPDEIITNVGGYGIIAFYKGNKPGKTIAVRADMDALPIPENNDLPYKSLNQGVAHLCGHDGHTTIALGTAKIIAAKRDRLKGNVAFIFQPAEETGTGADAMLNDDKMKGMHFDKIFALHNLPGFEKDAIIVRKGVFASSSIGVKIHLYGAPSHAGHPEDGNSPVLAMTALIDTLHKLPQLCTPLHRAALVTVIHSRLGEIAFGTTPGYANVMATLRAHYDYDLDTMKDKLPVIVSGICNAYELRYEMEWVEYFPAMNNDPESVELTRDAARKYNLTIIEREYPFAWAEDFACFTKLFKGAIFGLGAGINHPQVHNDNYDFPDELIETGVTMFTELIDSFLKKQ